MFDKILSTPTEQLGRASRFTVHQIKLWSHCARLLKKNKAGQQAAALAYYTIFGIVPLAIVMLLAFRLLPSYSGVGERFKNIVYEQFQLSTIKYPDPAHAGEEVVLTEYLDSIVAGFFKGLNEGSIALISAILIIWAAIGLLMTIEKAFNTIWHVAKPRSLLNRVINYWTLLTLGPLLIGVGIYSTTHYSILGHMRKTFLSNIAPSIISYLIATIAFFLLYFIMPNTKVKARAALWASALAALLWTLAKWGFKIYVIKFIPYASIYGLLGLIPLSVFWIYVTWLIVLFGLELAFTTQYLDVLDAAEIDRAAAPEKYFVASEITFINVAREIAAAFSQNKAPIPSEVICGKLNLPPEFGEKLFSHLVASGLFAKASEPVVGFVPARDPENITLAEIAEVASAAAFVQASRDPSPLIEKIRQSQKDTLRTCTLKQTLAT